MEPIKLVVFDLNATLIDDKTWPKFQALMGLSETEDLTLWQLNKEGVLPNTLWVEIVNNIYRQRSHHTRAEILQCLLDFAFLPGAEQAVSALQSTYTVAIISGSPDILVAHIAQHLGIDLYSSNATLLFDDKDYFKELRMQGEEPQAKLHHLKGFCQQLGIQPHEVACIGDGDNDIELFRATGHGITFQHSPIAAEAWKIINDLSELPGLLAI